MSENTFKKMAQALEMEIEPIVSVADFVDGKERFMKTLTETTEKLDQVCQNRSLDEHESEVRHLVDMFVAILEKSDEQFHAPESQNAFQRIFEKAKDLLSALNAQWKNTP